MRSEAAIAAASVTRTISRTRTRSSTLLAGVLFLNMIAPDWPTRRGPDRLDRGFRIVEKLAAPFGDCRNDLRPGNCTGQRRGPGDRGKDDLGEPCDAGHRHQALTSTESARRHRRQLGRASCRERWCQDG